MDKVEKVARAIYDAIDPNTGDSIATTIHCSEHIPPHGTIAEQLEQVMETCRAAARAAIEAYEGAMGEGGGSYFQAMKAANDRIAELEAALSPAKGNDGMSEKHQTPKGWKFDPFATVRMGRSLFELRAEDWLVRDDDEASLTPTEEKPE